MSILPWDPTLQGLDELFAQSPARRLLGPEHADAMAAAAERRNGGGGYGGSSNAQVATPAARNGQREEPVPLPTARKLVRLNQMVVCCYLGDIMPAQIRRCCGSRSTTVS